MLFPKALALTNAKGLRGFVTSVMPPILAAKSNHEGSLLPEFR